MQPGDASCSTTFDFFCAALCTKQLLAPRLPT
jgi:hypothetical protein